MYIELFYIIESSSRFHNAKKNANNYFKKIVNYKIMKSKLLRLRWNPAVYGLILSSVLFFCVM